MGAVNKAVVMGNLGSDPDMRKLPDGTAAAVLSIATTEKWKDKASGEGKEHTEWHRVVFYGRRAEIAGEYLKKGSPVYIEGRLRTRSWDQDGITRWTTEIVGHELQLIGSRPQSSGAPTSAAAPATRNEPVSNPYAFDMRTGGFVDDDIPF